ncbi:MAG: ribosomal-processing cysteine protease Prp [Oscillospiraceae bacterium]|nr:ribosomal-processing cysteine protease Prp [Oscillospiraceae bacterium]
MITVRVEKSGQKIKAFSVSGHAGYADKGQDIVCASVTSAVQLTANAITEQFRERAQVTVGENQISLRLKSDAGREAALLLQALLEHLTILSEDYKNTIQIIVSEV